MAKKLTSLELFQSPNTQTQTEGALAENKRATFSWVMMWITLIPFIVSLYFLLVILRLAVFDYLANWYPRSVTYDLEIDGQPVTRQSLIYNNAIIIGVLWAVSAVMLVVTMILKRRNRVIDAKKVDEQ